MVAGMHVWSGGDDGVIKVWSLEEQTNCVRTFTLDNGKVFALTWCTGVGLIYTISKHSCGGSVWGLQAVKHLRMLGPHIWCTGNSPYIYVLDAKSCDLVKTLSGALHIVIG